jgi:hypothetical protein
VSGVKCDHLLMVATKALPSRSCVGDGTKPPLAVSSRQGIGRHGGRAAGCACRRRRHTITIKIIIIIITIIMTLSLSPPGDGGLLPREVHQGPRRQHAQVRAAASRPV